MERKSYFGRKTKKAITQTLTNSSTEKVRSSRVSMGEKKWHNCEEKETDFWSIEILLQWIPFEVGADWGFLFRPGLETHCTSRWGSSWDFSEMEHFLSIFPDFFFRSSSFLPLFFELFFVPIFFSSQWGFFSIFWWPSEREKEDDLGHYALNVASIVDAANKIHYLIRPKAVVRDGLINRSPLYYIGLFRATIWLMTLVEYSNQAHLEKKCLKYFICTL